LIGIGAGNDIHYVKYFGKQYKVPFPLIPDKPPIIYKKIAGDPGTPVFIGVKLQDDGNSKVFFTHLGPGINADKFLDIIIKKSGLK
jgi:hypothetical protein